MIDLKSALMAVATGVKVTPVTHVTQGDVTPKTAWIKDVAPVTCVTQENNEGQQSADSDDGFGSGQARLFLAKGMAERHIRMVIKLLKERDLYDDRKSCAECRNYIAGNCLKREQPVGQTFEDEIALVLHRCQVFAPDLKEAKHD